MARFWVMNLDSEDELARGAHYRLPSWETRAAHAARARASGLVSATDSVLDESPAARGLRGTAGITGEAFMRTPAALRRLTQAGVPTPRAPSLEVLRRANTRTSFAPLLPQSLHVHTLAAAEKALQREAPSGLWLCKRALGAAGRGHRRIRAGILTDHDRSWLERSLARTGGLELSPWVERLGDFALHGWVQDGACLLGVPTVQVVDPRGTWQSTRVAEADELSVQERAALESTAREVSAELGALGYFGPFGIDAFRYRGADISPAFCPRCDVNARYTMGFATGMSGANLPET